MLNHIRTLLLNETQDSAAFEQYIQPDFHPLDLTGVLADFRNAFIKNSHPRAYKNFVSSVVARLVHESPFQRIIDTIDPRITFDLSGSLGDIKDTISMVNVKNGSYVSVVGVFFPDPDAAIYSKSWHIKKIDTSNVEIFDVVAGTVVQKEISFSGDISNPCYLDDRSSLYFQIVGASSVPDIEVTIIASSPISINVLEILEKLNTSTDMNEIFSSSKYFGYMQELANAFYHSDRPDFKIAAAAVAFALKIDENHWI